MAGIGVFFCDSGIDQSGLGGSNGVVWEFDPIMIGIGAVFIVGSVLLYKDARSKLK